MLFLNKSKKSEIEKIKIDHNLATVLYCCHKTGLNKRNKKPYLGQFLAEVGLFSLNYEMSIAKGYHAYIVTICESLCERSL